MAIVKWLFVLALLETIALCLVASFRVLNLESTIVFLFFNFLFVAFIFQVNGTLNRKLSILAAGNVFGLFLNVGFFLFVDYGIEVFGNSFEAFCDVAFPFLNSMWIVPYWSFSLGLLPRLNKNKTGG